MGISAKEKAIEMVKQYQDLAANQIFANWHYYHKQCASVACDFLIQEADDRSIGFWIKVQKEIRELEI